MSKTVFKLYPLTIKGGMRENTMNDAAENAVQASFLARWGNLTLLEEHRAPLVLTADGKSYVADTKWGPRLMWLRCDCGFEFTLKKTDFPGRRVMRDCNRPECPYASARVARADAKNRPRRRHAERVGSTHSVYLSDAYSQYLRDYARKRGISFSAAFEHAVEEGIKWIIANED